MKCILSFLLGLMTCTSLSAQSPAATPLKAVFDLASADTTDLSTALRQINNARREVPNMEITLVIHGGAVFHFLKEAPAFQERIAAAKKQGIGLAVCNNSLRRNNIEADRVKAEATIVPSAVVELIRKQAEGWSYIRVGH
jgi:intracellular sulfur oxidation DsrE/DsrF family protein